MITKVLLPLVALLGLSFAVYTVVKSRETPSPSRPIVTPPTHPPMKAIAGAGLIEARKKNIPIGAPEPGVVTEVFVSLGQTVEKGDKLFQLDDRELRSQLLIREAAKVSAEAILVRLKHAPRKEDIPPAEAAVLEARARLDDAEAALGRSQRLFERQMLPAGDYDKDRFAASAARATLAKVEADLRKIKAGTWEEDLKVAQASLFQAESEVESVKIRLERLTVRAFAEGEVLQINVDPGQFAAAIWKDPLIVLGDVNRLHVRVDIDENDAPLFSANAAAIGTLKGRPQIRFNLEYVKTEPYIIPKKSLTGDNNERVDTRVLQVLYALPDRRETDLHVGQQLDVYIQTSENKEAIALEVPPNAKKPFDEPSDKAKLAQPTAPSPTPVGTD